jgi:hypothetical protein
MKLINWHTLVILSWDEFKEIVDLLPEEYVVKLAKRFGIKDIELPYTRDKLMAKIFTEAEEGM